MDLGINEPYFDFSLLLNKSEFDLLIQNSEIAVQLAENTHIEKGFVIQVGKYHGRSRQLLGKYLYCKVTSVTKLDKDKNGERNKLIVMALDRDLTPPNNFL